MQLDVALLSYFFRLTKASTNVTPDNYCPIISKNMLVSEIRAHKGPLHQVQGRVILFVFGTLTTKNSNNEGGSVNASFNAEPRKKFIVSTPPVGRVHTGLGLGTHRRSPQESH